MPNFSMEMAILTSMILGIIMAFFNVGGVFALVIVGFVAVFLTKDEDASYKVGALAAILLALLYFVICLFTPPDLPYQLPNAVTIGVGYAVDGLFTLVLGLMVSVIIYGLFGSIGGYFADKLFKSQDKPKNPRISERPKRIIKRKQKPQRRTLNRR
ncbi:MAG: hypothetical protein PHY53_10050 [Methanobacterium formicicum]|jgi:uncharacterized protein YneF (UPF0154 family)|uniref:Putative membrane protein n=1 Tax=Methanobacterium formicicum TaxID=2162 RepID=A0A089ZDG4_METFO|nr:hypothetical protein [Methanobacterium formicicum]AIS32067.1 hypothetical protein BRM9_1252 [Methanobacterium formicicum]MBF4474489.1 hypothetical protein [Methanobacterium formicicum]MDD4811513.1 hypothetical protein [Methanobacterium formicicum]CEL24701.1 putative membrane protein [Methanobacterium formicicum]